MISLEQKRAATLSKYGIFIDLKPKGYQNVYDSYRLLRLSLPLLMHFPLQACFNATDIQHVYVTHASEELYRLSIIFKND